MRLIEKINFINSYSFTFSPRPGTVAANFETVDKKITDERLKIIQNKLFSNQIKRNKSLEGQIVEVLVENQMKDKKRLFGRSKYMTPVIFDGTIITVGKIVQVEINGSNQNSLFGKIKLDHNKKVA